MTDDWRPTRLEAERDEHGHDSWLNAPNREPVHITETELWKNITARQGTIHPPKEEEPTDEELNYGGYCEDYPCCGHTPDDPCTRQPYDEPDYYDTSIKGQEHRLCDHESGDCQVEYDESDAYNDDWEY